MESFFTRYRNPSILALVLLAQVLGLAVQVKRPVDPGNPDGGTVRLLRSWVIGAITPVEEVFVSTSRFIRRTWHDYINVVGLRAENRELREQNEKLHLDLARQADSANQAQRLQALLDFKQHFLSNTVAAQVVGSSGSEASRVIYINKGSRDGIRPDMAVITPHGVVGKVRDVYRSSAQVLMINDPSSGVGAILENTRLHGVVKGTPAGEVMLVHIMTDEQVTEGERLVTSGGDRIFPKGLPVGTVAQVSPGPELFLNVRIKPAANLTRLEEVLVITEMQAADVESAEDQAPVRAADILAQRLPSVPKKPDPVPPKKAEKKPVGQTIVPEQAPAGAAKTGAPATGAPSAATPAANTATGASVKPTGTLPGEAKPGSAPAKPVTNSTKPNSTSGEASASPQTETAPTTKPQESKPANPKPKASPSTGTGTSAKPEKPATKPPATQPTTPPAAQPPAKPADPEVHR